MTIGGTIVCVVGEPDDGALRVARRLGERLSARLVVVRVTSDVAERESVRTGGPLDRLEHGVGERNPVDAVTEIAAAAAAELIVVGSEPGLRRGVLRAAFGRELASLAPCPVVVAPPESADATSSDLRDLAGSRPGARAVR